MSLTYGKEARFVSKEDPIPPVGVDLDRPSVARVYDYYLGGTTNWSIDRKFGDQVMARFPLVRHIALANRQYLNRVVRHLSKLGVRQFLDIGAGVPTAGNTHQVADELAVEAGRTPDARVVYVDNEPVAVAHAEVLLDKEGDATRHAVIDADLRDPDDLWRKARETELFDLDQPVALLLIAVLHVQQPDQDGRDIGPEAVARFRELLPTGSYLAISHGTDVWRPRADIGTLIGDFEAIEPGWCWTSEWHPEETGPGAPDIDFPEPNHAAVWAGVGRKI